MKNKIAKIWSVGLVAVLLITLFSFAAPASAGTLSWSADSSVPSTTGNMLVDVSGKDIVDIAVASDGSTIYAVTGNSDNVSYKSQDSGKTWTAMSALTSSLTASLISVAPDDPSIIVALGGTSNLVGYVSTNGGSNWSNLNVSGPTAVYGIDISALSAGTRYIALAGTGGANDPELWYFNLGSAAPAWTNAVTGTGWSGGPADPIDNIKAVKFSPNFASDQIAVAVSEEIGTTSTSTYGYAKYHILSFNQKKWDSSGGFTSYPVTLESYTSNSTAFTVNNAAISLDPNYLGGDDTTRIAFIGASITHSTEVGGIYRQKDTTSKQIKDTTGIKSVAWNGTNLVAGATASNIVYRSADALSTDPTVSASSSLKRIGGASNVVVAWSGSSVVGGSSGASSAFGVSGDNGKTWNDISLIDTALTTHEDFWITPDGAKSYLLTNDATDTSLWRKDASGWQRVFWLTSTAGYIVRGAPDNNDVLYIADDGSGATNMYYTSNAGQTQWLTRSSRYAIQDLAVESADAAYVAQYNTATVSKTTNAGFTWGTAKDTELYGGIIHSITSLGKDKLIVGGTTGYIAYSADGNSSWTKITSQTESSALLTQVTASGLASGDYIYAASTKAGFTVRRWKIGTSTSWTDLAAPTGATYKAYGVSLLGGVLYVLSANGTDSDLLRTLNPSSSSDPTWASQASAGEAFNAPPSALRVSGTKLWAVNTLAAGKQLWSYTDILATAGPKLLAPANKFQNAVNSVTGRSVDVGFSWEEPASEVTSYQLKIYADASGDTLVKSITTSDTVVLVGPFQGTAQQVEFSPGATYYWRVRSSAPIYSPYSEMRSITIAPGVALVPAILSPTNGAAGSSRTPSFSWAPVSGTTSYEFKLADNVYLNNPLVDTTVLSSGFAMTTELEYGKTYYWAVKALAPVEGGWSAVANFTVMTLPVAPTPPVVVQQVPPPVINIPAPPPATEIVIPPPPAPPAPIAPAYIWAIIIIGAVLVIAVIVLIVRTRRVA